MVQSYKDLIVWQKSMDLAVEIYLITNCFPKDELYSLTNQIRRAAVSIPSNIAEGRRRNSKLDYLHFLTIAHGSLAETETQLLIAIRLNYLNDAQVEHVLQLQEEISKMLHSMRSKLGSD
jgi:four helix bundle protein